MAAISTLMLATLKPGDKILTHFSLYGGTNELVNKILPGFNITAIIEDLRDLNIAEGLLRADPAIKMLYLETPANPTIQCVDVEELSKLAKRYNCIVACDNTFATPYLQQPFKYDVDFIVLAGFLLLVPPFLVKIYNQKMINIHPALLPKYGGKGMHGLNVHQAVISAGDTELPKSIAH